MPRFTQKQVAQKLEVEKIIPLFFHHDFGIAQNVVKSCYNAGCRVLEFTNRGERAHEIFTQLVTYTREEFPEMILGSGSIMNAESTRAFIESGADFIVSPILNKAMADVCNQHKILWSPGCGTLTEITKANRWGAKIVKVFPGSHLGPDFIKAVLGPCPWLKLMPTGGVSPDNLEDWFKAGAICAGMGSKLIRKDLVKNEAYNKLTDHISSVRNLAQSYH